jgi:hypothetical protein
MSLQSNASFAVARHGGMDAAKSQKLSAENLAADDLYVFCPGCKTKRVGTLEKLQEGCPCAKTST